MSPMLQAGLKKHLSTFLSATVAALGLAVLPVEVQPASATLAQPVSVTTPNSPSAPFGFYIVPAGVTTVRIVARGGAGGEQSSVNGNAGALVTATLAVTAGQILQYVVGGNGGLAGAASPGLGGYNGGGDGGAADMAYASYGNAAGGGGATDIRVCASADTSLCSLADRILVAGGGGGRAGTYGGRAGLLGADAEPGNNGGVATNPPSGTNGGGATQTSGGVGGANDMYDVTFDGQAGAVGVGGPGASAVASHYYSAGAGGGGGYFGGGGGATRGGGGGGGSSVAPTANFKSAYYSGIPATSSYPYINGSSDLPGSLTIDPIPNAPTLDFALSGVGNSDAIFRISQPVNGAASTIFFVVDQNDPNSYCTVAASSAPLECTIGGLTSGTPVSFIAYGYTAVGYFAYWLSPPIYSSSGVQSAASNTVTFTPGSKKISFDANGGTGTIADLYAYSSTTLPSNSFTKAQHVFSVWNTSASCTSSGTFVNNGANFTPTADTTLYACWVGALEISTSLNGVSTDSVDFGTVAAGTVQTATLHLRNVGAIGSRMLYFSNGGLSTGQNLNVENGATCNLSGGQLAPGATCTYPVTWSPTSTQTLYPNSAVLSIQATSMYTVHFAGQAISNRVVTFNANGGSGSMGNQVGITSAVLSANTMSNSGYTFAGWNTQANGSGSSYADGASYPFSSSTTLYAQWTLAPTPPATPVTPVTPVRPVTPVAPAPAVEILGPQITVPGHRVFVEGAGQTLQIEGRRFDDLIAATIAGVELKVLSNTSDSIKLDLGELKVGTYDLMLKFKGGSLIYQDAITVTAKTPPTNSSGSAHKLLQRLIAGYAGDSALMTSAVKAGISAAIAKLPFATSLVCVGSTSNSAVTAKDRALARARALAACNFAKSKLPQLKTRIKLNPSSGLTASARNVLLKLSN